MLVFFRKSMVNKKLVCIILLSVIIAILVDCVGDLAIYI